LDRTTTVVAESRLAGLSTKPIKYEELLDNSEVDRLKQEIERLSDITRANTLQQLLESERDIWRLVSALFDPVYGDTMDVENSFTIEDQNAMQKMEKIRKDLFGRWLKQSVRRATEQDVRRVLEEGKKSGRETNADVIFYLMAGRQIKDAVAMALRGRNYHLATILSQVTDCGGCNQEFSGGGGLDDAARDDLYAQLNVWNEMNRRISLTSSDKWPIPPAMLRIYQYLCSDLEKIHDSVKLDWKRTLGMA
jgi:hypothetical protein